MSQGVHLEASRRSDAMPRRRPEPGLGRQVVRNSVWSMAGQAAALAATLIATPFVIHILGSDGYGVLILLNTIMTYLAFADLGMAEATTKFGADAYSRGESEKEGAVIWTGMVAAAAPVVGVALALVLTARPVVTHILKVPAEMQASATWALQLMSVAFIARAVGNIVNTPQLARLRIDLHTLVISGGNVVQICILPVVLWLYGGGVLAAVTVITGVAVVTALLQTVIARKLLPCLDKPRLEPRLIRPLVKYGSAVAIMSLVAVVTTSAEKIVLPTFVSVQALAYYSVAFSLAGLMALLPVALGQSLLPAFARLSTGGEHDKLQLLFTRVLRIHLFSVCPLALVLLVVAKPFLTVWAGPEYGRESTWPLYILIAGCCFDVLAYVADKLLRGVGRADVLARYHVAILVPYLLAVALLSWRFAALGAALAWSGRAIVGMCWLFLAVSRVAGVSCRMVSLRSRGFAVAVGALAIPGLLLGLGVTSLATTLGITFVSVFLYGTCLWVGVLTDEERTFVKQSIGARCS